MPRSTTQARRHAILDSLRDHNEVSVEALSRTLDTSEVTIRKDLAALETSGLLIRRYGGAVPVPEANLRPVSAYKLAIGRCAAGLLRDHDRVAIDSGSTTSELIPSLVQYRGLVVMTNSLDAAQQLQALDPAPTLLMCGGTWDERSESFQGQVASDVVASYDFDLCFIGADGLDLARGSTTFSELTGLSQVMARVSRRVVLMAEADKIGRRIPNLELSWSSIDDLVTDARITTEQHQAIAAQEVRVHIAVTGE